MRRSKRTKNNQRLCNAHTFYNNISTRYIHSHKNTKERIQREANGRQKRFSFGIFRLLLSTSFFEYFGIFDLSTIFCMHHYLNIENTQCIDAAAIFWSYEAKSTWCIFEEKNAWKSNRYTFLWRRHTTAYHSLMLKKQQIHHIRFIRVCMHLILFYYFSDFFFVTLSGCVRWMMRCWCSVVHVDQNKNVRSGCVGVTMYTCI